MSLNIQKRIFINIHSHILGVNGVDVPRIEGITETMLRVQWQKMLAAHNFLVAIFAELKCVITKDVHLEMNT